MPLCARISIIKEKSKKYVLPSSVDILMYIYEGNDKKTPDTELEDGDVRSSFDAYIQGFRAEDEEARVTMGAGMTNNGDWYTFCFTGHGGSINEVTTYGVFCYFKSYYGVYQCSRSLQSTLSRIEKQHFP